MNAPYPYPPQIFMGPPQMQPMQQPRFQSNNMNPMHPQNPQEMPNQMRMWYCVLFIIWAQFKQISKL